MYGRKNGSNPSEVICLLSEYKAGDIVLLKPLEEISDRGQWIVDDMISRFGTTVQISTLENGCGSFRINNDIGYSWSLSWIKSRVGDDLIIK